MDRTTQRIDVGGHELRVVLSGEGPPDLLCLHGLVDRIEIWDRDRRHPSASVAASPSSTSVGTASPRRLPAPIGARTSPPTSRP